MERQQGIVQFLPQPALSLNPCLEGFPGISQFCRIRGRLFSRNEQAANGFPVQSQDCRQRLEMTSNLAVSVRFEPERLESPILRTARGEGPEELKASKHALPLA